jgi:hypothetical protein
MIINDRNATVKCLQKEEGTLLGWLGYATGQKDITLQWLSGYLNNIVNNL